MQAAQAIMNQQPLGTLEEQVERYKQVLDVMPAGVILLDTQGVVHEANPEAQRLLEMPLIGQKWFEVIQQAFAPREDDGHEISLRNGRKVRLAISASTTGQLILITDLTETRLLQSRISDLQRLSSLGVWLRRWRIKSERLYPVRCSMRQIWRLRTYRQQRKIDFRIN